MSFLALDVLWRVDHGKAEWEQRDPFCKFIVVQGKENGGLIRRVTGEVNMLSQSP